MYVGMLIIMYAIAVHQITGVVLILTLTPAPARPILGRAAVLRFEPAFRYRHAHRRAYSPPFPSWAYWPQQLLLVIAAVGALVAVVMGNYADGVTRPTLFTLWRPSRT